MYLVFLKRCPVPLAAGPFFDNFCTTEMHTSLGIKYGKANLRQCNNLEHGPWTKLF